MKYSHASSNSLLAVEWRTPVGPMEGLLGPDGWLGLTLPRESEADFCESRPVEWFAATWMRDAAYGRPSAAMLKDIDELTGFLGDLFHGKAPGCRPRIGLAARSTFEGAVWRALGEIGFGQTITYGELATRAGRPNGARAVGQVMRRNPLVLLTPCHRVLASGGGANRLGGFTGGLTMKRFLLEREGHAKCDFENGAGKKGGWKGAVGAARERAKGQAVLIMS